MAKVDGQNTWRSTEMVILNQEGDNVVTNASKEALVRSFLYQLLSSKAWSENRPRGVSDK